MKNWWYLINIDDYIFLLEECNTLMLYYFASSGQQYLWSWRTNGYILLMPSLHLYFLKKKIIDAISTLLPPSPVIITNRYVAAMIRMWWLQHYFHTILFCANYFVAVLEPFLFHFVLHYYNTTLPWYTSQRCSRMTLYYIQYLCEC